MQGQYEDQETGLYYNRYRYFDANICAYVSQDPLGLLAGSNVYSYPFNPLRYTDPLGLKCPELGTGDEPEVTEKTINCKNRKEALRKAKDHAQVPRVSKGGVDIEMNELRENSRGNNWGNAKSNNGKKLGRRNSNGKNEWFEHPDGHPDAGQEGIPEHHSSGHIHSTNTKGEEKIFTW